MVFNRVYRLEIQSEMFTFFGPALWTIAPLTFSLVRLPPWPPFPKSMYNIIQTVCGWEGVGVLSCVGDHILQEFNTLFLTRFRIYKITLPPQTKTSEGRGPQTDEHLPQLQVNFLHSDIWHCFLSVQSFSESATRKGAKEVQPNDDLF